MMPMDEPPAPKPASVDHALRDYISEDDLFVLIKAVERFCRLNHGANAKELMHAILDYKIPPQPQYDEEDGALVGYLVEAAPSDVLAFAHEVFWNYANTLDIDSGERPVKLW